VERGQQQELLGVSSYAQQVVLAKVAIVAQAKRSSVDQDHGGLEID